MANINNAYVAASAVTVTNLSTLANGSIAVSDAINFEGGNKPVDCIVEVSVTANGTPSGNRQVRLLGVTSTDGTNYGDSSNLANMLPIARFEMPATNNVAIRMNGVAIAAAFGGELPGKIKIAVLNDCGVAFSAGALQIREVYKTN